MDKTAIQSTKRNVVVITSYPPKNSLYGAKVGGLASFAKNTLNSLSSHFNFIILAEVHEQAEEYLEGENKVIRCWKRNNLSYIGTLCSQLRRYRKSSDDLIVQFEFSIYGTDMITGFFPIVLIYAKLLGFKTTLVLHQVVLDLSTLSQHLGLNEKDFTTKIKTTLMRLFYTVLLALSRKVVVLDEIHKQKLLKLVKTNKIYAIPHGVEAREFKPVPLHKHSKDEPFKILVFGFIGWYKGTDWIIEKFLEYLKQNPTNPYNFQLIIAGGESPTQKNNPTYQEYYKNVLRMIEEGRPAIIHTGFVAEEDFPTIFSEADTVILPYKTLMSSSGPLSLAMTYERPFLLSENLEGYLITNDIQNEMEKLNINKSDITFSLANLEIFTKLEKISKDANLSQNMEELSRRVKNHRSWNILGENYFDVIETKSLEVVREVNRG